MGAERIPRVPAPGAESGPAGATQQASTPGHTAIVLANPAAAGMDIERLRSALARSFGPAGFEIGETDAGDQGDESLHRLLRDAVARGRTIVVAAGGDGTVSRVAQALWRLGRDGRDLSLAIVPMGTANVLARELEIPTDLEGAVALAAASPRVREIDGLDCDDDLILTQVGVGLDAAMIRDTPAIARRRFGRLSYLWVLARRSFGYRSRLFHILHDGRRRSFRAWQVVVANASTLGAKPFTWGPAVDPSDGVADLCIFEVRRWRDLLHLTWHVLTGRHEATPYARFLRVPTEVTISSTRPVPVQGDGELLGHTPIRVRVVPRAVRIVVPAAVPGPAPSAPGDRAAEPPAQAAPRGSGARTTLRSRLAQLRKRMGVADTTGYLALNRLNGGPRVDAFLGFASRLCDWGEIWIATSVITALGNLPRFGNLPLLIVPPLWFTMWTINFPIKSLFRRKRPFLLHERARLVGRKPSDSSFPSGHTAAAFAGAMLMSPYLQAWSPFFWAYAVTVAFSRIYLGVHYPADVIVGALLGLGLGSAYGTAWVVLMKAVGVT